MKMPAPETRAVDELVQQLVPPAMLVLVALKHYLGQRCSSPWRLGPSTPLAFAKVERAAVVLALDPELSPVV